MYSHYLCQCNFIVIQKKAAHEVDDGTYSIIMRSGNAVVIFFSPSLNFGFITRVLHNNNREILLPALRSNSNHRYRLRNRGNLRCTKKITTKYDGRT